MSPPASARGKHAMVPVMWTLYITGTTGFWPLRLAGGGRSSRRTRLPGHPHLFPLPFPRHRHPRLYALQDCSALGPPAIQPHFHLALGDYFPCDPFVDAGHIEGEGVLRHLAIGDREGLPAVSHGPYRASRRGPHVSRSHWSVASRRTRALRKGRPRRAAAPGCHRRLKREPFSSK